MQAKLDNGEETQILGKIGYGSDNYTRSLNLQGNQAKGTLRTVRVRSGGMDTKVLWEMELRNEDGRVMDTVKTESGGDWKSFDLRADERIIGVFGQSYKDHYNCLKELGFIVGKEK